MSKKRYIPADLSTLSSNWLKSSTSGPAILRGLGPPKRKENAPIAPAPAEPVAAIDLANCVGSLQNTTVKNAQVGIRLGGKIELDVTADITSTHDAVVARPETHFKNSNIKVKAKRLK